MVEGSASTPLRTSVEVVIVHFVTFGMEGGGGGGKEARGGRPVAGRLFKNESFRKKVLTAL
jgi:hypothetical protein